MKTFPPPASRVLPLVVAAQFACTSLWFAGNAVLPGLLHEARLVGTPLSTVVSAVQFGFIVGTLVFALFALADRMSPSKLFLLCAIAGSLFNAGLLLPGQTTTTLLVLRFAVGFFLAGIYPVGMKIAADYTEGGLGRALGYLVGALVLGTALPHLLRLLAAGEGWRGVVLATSGLALSGGVLLWWRVPDGPFRRPGSRLQPGAVWQVFRDRPFRAAALGYFGHMWELYTFWAFVPLWLAAYAQRHPGSGLLGPGWAFGIIAVGAPACVAGGYLAQRVGSRRTARLALAISGACCLLSPLLLALPLWAFGALMALWGMAVVADSPQFSTLVAQQAPAATKGTALTLVTCLGFALTIVSLQAFAALHPQLDARYWFWLLAPGPLLGLWATRRAPAPEVG
ncbi:MFS transporter [Hymenobacter properus]|uniref:MFS transporter n=1 Tax=Hymenobacter properus TaxID=2791026 RepID=A0A931BLP9_9BACT|nr:MFS transporter [Hymenobacter properus]MBF9143666.1 MFS transporter [Hymenobacter properus]MBR7722479.1 MFS transporter [Microvirga sp. SRT04]